MALRETDQIPVRITQPGAVEEILPRVGASQALPAGQVKPATMEELRAILGLPADPAEAIVASGTYTPTFTGGANVDAVSAFGVSKFQRIGNIVSVAGQCNIDATAGSNTTTRFNISLPIASSFASAANLAGIGTARLNVSAHNPWTIRADTGSDDAEVEYPALSTLALIGVFSFQYEILS